MVEPISRVDVMTTVFFARKITDTPDRGSSLPSLEFNNYVNIPHRGHSVNKIRPIRDDFFDRF